MSNNDIVNMLTAYHLDQENDRVRAYFEKDNIWRILDIQRYEPSHSAFLVWFFSQKTIQYSQMRNLLNLIVSLADSSLLLNGWNDTSDMKSFANAIITGAYTINTVSVTPEMQINKISTIRYPDKIDIFIKCNIALYDSSGNEKNKDLEIIIENKVDSPEGEEKLNKLSNPTKAETKYQYFNQTERYYLACSRENGNRLKTNVDYQLFVFLTPNRAKCSSNNYVLMAYQDLVDCVFANFMKRDGISQDVKNLVEAYLRNLGNPYNKKNKEIIAMTIEERELLVSFFERNKPLFDATIKAMIGQAEDDGDAGAVKDFQEISKRLKHSGVRRLYTINGKGELNMKEVIAEFVIFKLKAGYDFAEIKNLLERTWKVGNRTISDTSNGVKIGSNNKPPYSFSHNGVTYYVTTELGDKNTTDTFYKFRVNVNGTEQDFQIMQI